MLKPHHTATEMKDLLSEYSLMKEVDHPNVIKLLGACTDRRGPIFLIMEFAKHGSLRNYLRRSRNRPELLRTQSRMSSNTSNSKATTSIRTMEDELELINQKDIISFAWQVARGMAYLADIKVWLKYCDIGHHDCIAVGAQRSCSS
jgi:proto-oncogene tyrosine-protein kinase Ret